MAMGCNWTRWAGVALWLWVAVAQAQPRGHEEPGTSNLRRMPIERPLPGVLQVRVGRFLSDRYLARGPRATGTVGDYFLRSRELLAVVRARDGGVADLALGPTFEDKLGGASFAVCDSRGRHPVTAKSFRLFTGARPALQVVGRLPGLRVETTFVLRPRARHLELITKVENLDRQRTRHNIAVCDQWNNGNTPLMVPGAGEVTRVGELEATWCGRSEGGLSTVLALPAKAPAMRLRLDFEGPRPSFDPVVDADYGRADLGPGQQLQVRRFFVLARGGLHLAVARALAVTGTARRKVQVTVSGGPPAGARIVLRRDGRPWLMTPAEGERSTLWLPERGTYVASLAVPGAGEGTASNIPASGEVVVGPPPMGQLAVELVQGKQGPAAKLLFEGIGRTPTPSFGNDGGLRAVNVVYSASGKETVTLAPGSYRVTATRGIDHTLATGIATVRAGAQAKLRLRLRRVIDTPGWISADLHLHTAASEDSPTVLAERLVSVAALGLGMVVLTDHNRVSAGPSGGPLVVSGQEVNTEGHLFGHFNVFPLRAGRPVDHRNTSPARLFREARKAGATLIQVNHPWRPGVGYGYFKLLGLDPHTGKARSPGYDGGFDLIEVLNGDDLDRPERMAGKWFALLNAGKRYVATGGSDAHRLPYQDPGYPRNDILWATDEKKAAGSPTVAEVLEALKRGRNVVTTGPRVLLLADGAPTGSQVKLGKGGSVALRIEVRAAPWVDVRRVVLVANGKPLQTFRLPGRRGGVVFQRTLALRPQRDTWYVVTARGERPDPTQIRKVLPFALTNPIWVDADGDGAFAAPTSVDKR